MKPINEWILIEEEEPMTRTAGGLYIPIASSKKQTLKRCKILDISEDVYEILREEGRELQYDIGDTVIHYSQTGIKVDNSDEKDRRFFLKYDAVMAICEDEEEEVEDAIPENVVSLMTTFSKENKDE